VTGLEFKFKGTVAREKAERCIQLLPCLRLRPEIEVANLNVEEKIADTLQQIFHRDDSSDQRNKRMQQFQEDLAGAAEHEAVARQTMATQS
jgi:hypothetical protein